MNDRSSILAAKAALPLPELLRALGFQPPQSGSGNMPSPFRIGDRQGSPSFSIFERAGSWGWVDRSGGGEDKGDEISLLEKLESLSMKEAIARFLDLAGIRPDQKFPPPAPRAPAAVPLPPPPSWEDLSAAFTPDQQRKLAAWRGYSPELVIWLQEQGILASYKGSPCLPVRNQSGRLLAVHVRPDSGKWFYEPKGAGLHPLILGNLEAAEITGIFESQWDLFAALEGMKFHLDPNPKVSFICTRGASNGRRASLARGKVYAFPQNDPEKHGKRAGEEWLKAVVAASPGEVYRVDTPANHADLNDWLRSGNIDEALKAAIESASLVPRPSPSPISKLQAELEEAVSPGEVPPPFEPIAFCEKIGLWWLDGSSSYFLQSGEGKLMKYREMGAAEVRRELRSHCLNAKVDINSPDPVARSMSEIDRVLHATTKARAVDAAASVAGTPAGVSEKQGGRLLVRNSPQLIEPLEAPCPLISRFLRKLLGIDGSIHFCYWIKIAYESLRAGEINPGQCLIICGPADCGKSFLQNHIITPILAGRAADPKSYFFGRTDFNSELVGSEHLLIEEVPSSNHHEDRNNFGEKIKEVVAGDLMRLHKKNRDAISVHPFHRISITINDHPDKMKALPPLTGDFTEKLIMLQAQDAREFFKEFDHAPNPRRAVMAAIEAELPAFCNELIKLEIPQEMRSRRYGVISHVPEQLASLLFEQEPESHLLLLIDKELFGHGSEYACRDWEGDAEDLQQFLTNDSRPSRKSAQKLMGYPSACGQLLAKLMNKYPKRFRKHRTANHRGWIISPPGGQQETA